MIGESVAFDVDIATPDVLAYAALSGDRNPLHLDPSYAARTEFGRPIAHGGILVGLVSRVIGMHLPGTRCLILSLRVSFPRPLFYPARVHVSARVRSFDSDRKLGSVRVQIDELSRQWRVLDGEVQFSLHDQRDADPADRSSRTERSELSQDRRASEAKLDRTAAVSPRKELLVTGGSGGVGSRVVPVLASRFDVTCLTRRQLTTDAPAVRYETIDLERQDELAAYLGRTSPGAFWGIVHMSAPPMPRGFLTDDVESLRRQLYHAVEVPVVLARWARASGSSVRRMVLLGSTAGTRDPSPHVGAYSLAKAAGEHLCRLLAADLGGIGATVNVVVPGPIPVGLNDAMSARTRTSLAGAAATGRLTDSRDVASVLLFLLSDEASQINGASIVIDGAVV